MVQDRTHSGSRASRGIRDRIVVVTGGRNFPHRFIVHDKLSELEPTLVLQGGCKTGADLWARRWCMHTGTPCFTSHALWDYYGDAAGPIRSEWMYQAMRVFETLAFSGGSGTEACVKASLEAGVPVWRCFVDRAPEYVSPTGSRPAEEG